MTSIIKLHALNGAYDVSPPCYLLQVDEFKFLLDCGWDERFNSDLTDRLVKIAPTIDAVLLSHPDPLHLGMLIVLLLPDALSDSFYEQPYITRMDLLFFYSFA